ncbi:MAG: GNAT family N-acetyltransferase [Magnetospirillum sp. WYHS-4]
MKKANIRWSWELGHVRPSFLGVLYRDAGFPFPDSADNSDFNGMFGPGAFGVFAFLDDKLVGSARVFSDDLTSSWLAEICIDSVWRGQGIGRFLMGKIDERFCHTALYCDAPTEAVEFFRMVGVRPKVKLNACLRQPATNQVDDHEVQGITIHDHASRYQAEAFDDVADSVGFGISDKGIPRTELYGRIFGNGTFGSFAETEDGRLVGFARAFSDDLTKTYVAEICVRPEWQGKGVGKALVNRVVRRYYHTAIYTEAFPSALRLFESCGIRPDSKLVGCSRAPLAPERTSSCL